MKTEGIPYICFTVIIHLHITTANKKKDTKLNLMRFN